MHFDRSGNPWVLDAIHKHIYVTGPFQGAEPPALRTLTVPFDRTPFAFAFQSPSMLAASDPQALADFLNPPDSLRFIPAAARRAGRHGSASGQYNDPGGVAVAGSGDIVVADTGNDRLQFLDGAGNVKCTYGRLGAGAGQFRGPVFVGVAGTTLYVGDQGNLRVVRLSLVGGRRACGRVVHGVSSHITQPRSNAQFATNSTVAVKGKGKAKASRG